MQGWVKRFLGRAGLRKRPEVFCCRESVTQRRKLFAPPTDRGAGAQGEAVGYLIQPAADALALPEPTVFVTGLLNRPLTVTANFVPRP